MKFSRIFTKKRNCKLWAVSCKSADGKGNSDVFTELTERFTDTRVLFDLFRERIEQLRTPFWKGMTVDDAIDQVLDEMNELETGLWDIVNENPNRKYRSFSDLFKPLHENIYSISFEEEAFRKAKADVNPPLVRIYAIELEDGTMIITDGAIKLTRPMDDDELAKLQHLKKILAKEQITDLDSLNSYLDENE